MKSLKEMINEELQTIKTFDDLKKYLERFPNNASSWRYATDEVREIAKTSREYLSEFDGEEVDALDFKSFKKPADWNTNGKKFIVDTVEKMSDKTRARFLKDIGERFGLQ